MKKQNLLSIFEYAKLCGVSGTVIRKRISRKEIKTKLVHNVNVINILIYPPESARIGGRRLISTILGNK